MPVMVIRKPHKVDFSPFKSGIAIETLFSENKPIFCESVYPASSHVTPPSVVFSIIIWLAGKNINLFALAELIRGLIPTSVVPLS
jgi:hypothetical protein